MSTGKSSGTQDAGEDVQGGPPEDEAGNGIGTGENMPQINFPWPSSASLRATRRIHHNSSILVDVVVAWIRKVTDAELLTDFFLDERRFLPQFHVLLALATSWVRFMLCLSYDEADMQLHVQLGQGSDTSYQ